MVRNGFRNHSQYFPLNDSRLLTGRPEAAGQSSSALPTGGSQGREARVVCGFARQGWRRLPRNSLPENPTFSGQRFKGCAAVVAEWLCRTEVPKSRSAPGCRRLRVRAPRLPLEVEVSWTAICCAVFVGRLGGMWQEQAFHSWTTR